MVSTALLAHPPGGSFAGARILLLQGLRFPNRGGASQAMRRSFPSRPAMLITGAGDLPVPLPGAPSLQVDAATFAELLPFILVGFAAQLVDGALGMAFGVISST